MPIATPVLLGTRWCTDQLLLALLDRQTFFALDKGDAIACIGVHLLGAPLEVPEGAFRVDGALPRAWNCERGGEALDEVFRGRRVDWFVPITRHDDRARLRLSRRPVDKASPVSSRPMDHDSVARVIKKLAEVSRHKSLDTLRGYVRRVDLFREHAGAACL
jgi:hypothetical protein